MVNGLDPVQFPPIAFIDLDGVVFEEGTDRFTEGAPDHLRTLAKTHKIVFFTSRSVGSWTNEIAKLGIPGERLGYMLKPLGCSYIYVDDRLDWENCGESLADVESTGLRSSSVWAAKEAETQELGID